MQKEPFDLVKAIHEGKQVNLDAILNKNKSVKELCETFPKSNWVGPSLLPGRISVNQKFFERIVDDLTDYIELTQALAVEVKRLRNKVYVLEPEDKSVDF